MKLFTPVLAVTLTFVGSTPLVTKYTTDRAFKVTIASSSKMEVTKMEREKDGERQDSPAGGASTEVSSEEVHVDTIVEAEDGKATKVRRHFVKVGGSSSFSMGDQSRDSKLESPFEGITVELERAKDGSADAKVVEGSEPKQEKALEGHHVELFLDGLLPDKKVDVGDSWDIEKDAITRILRQDVRSKLYPPPERDGESGGRGGGGGGGGRRGGGMRGGGGGGGIGNLDWEGKATLKSLNEEVDGVACAIVEIEFNAKGTRDMPMGRGPRGGMFEPEATFDNTMEYTAKLKGRFAFSTAEHRPVLLDLEGNLRQETRMEFERDGSSTKSHSVSEGALTYKVEVSAEKPEDAKSKESEKKK